MSVVTLSGVTRSYGAQEALSEVSLSVQPGERVAVLGHSGAGKSTLLALMNGSLRPTTGTVEAFGCDLATLRPPGRRALQRRIGTISQRLDLIEGVRVLHNVAAGALGRWSTARALAALAWPRPDATVITALERVALGWAVNERTERLSGGERQRVAIARLLVQAPDLVLADEPVSSLDPARADEVLTLLGAVAGDGALVVNLHQPELARRHCTRAIGLREGRVVLDVGVDQLRDDVLAHLYDLQRPPPDAARADAAPALPAAFKP